MNWLPRLLRRAPWGSDAASVRLIQFDTSGWTPMYIGRRSHEWCNTDGDTLCACVYGKPARHLEALSDLESLRAFYRRRFRQCAATHIPRPRTRRFQEKIRLAAGLC